MFVCHSVHSEGEGSTYPTYPTPASFIWWSSLETSSNLFIGDLPPPPKHVWLSSARYASYWNAVTFVHKPVITYRCEQFWWTFTFQFPNWNPDPTHMSPEARGEFHCCLWHTLFRCLTVKTAPLNTLIWQMSTRQTAVHYQYNQCNFLLDKICRKHYCCFMSFVSRRCNLGCLLVCIPTYSIRLIIPHIRFLSDEENHKLVKLRQQMRGKQWTMVN